MKEQNPFSIYDFLGYLIPGFLSLIIIFLIQQLENGHGLQCIFSNLKGEISLTQSVIIILISYFIAHILNFISSVTVEKYSQWRYDYPSNYLLQINHSYRYLTGQWHVIVWRLFVALLLLPIVFGDYVFGEKFNFKDVYVRSLDNYLIDSVTEKFKKLI